MLHAVGMLGVAMMVTAAAGPEGAAFRTARPIWPEGKEKEKNLFVGFRAVFEAPAAERVVLRVAGHTLYRVYFDGRYVGYGPARAGHGYYRVDEWDLTDRLTPGRNLVAIEVAGYNANSYYVLNEPSFLQAEVVAGPRVLAATNGDGAPFEARVLTERVRKVQRYSFQRPFSEVYRLREGFDVWREDPAFTFPAVKCSVVEPKKLLPRRVPYPAFDRRGPLWDVSDGRITRGVKPDKLWKDRSLTGIGPKLAGFPENELETIPSIELQQVAFTQEQKIDAPLPYDARIVLKENTYHIVDFGTNLTGFIGTHVTAHRKSRVFFLFDEILSSDDVDFKRLGCVNIVSYELEPGTYDVESFEPYTLRYLKLVVLEGQCAVSKLYLREYANPDVWRAHFACSDERLNRLFAAGRETFAQNAVDVFMDCPSRERAGWLCDSFFTSRVAKDLAGDTVVEKNFFENFLLPARFEFLPDGMLPMCYPADHNDGVFIPNWALWFVVQLEEYAARSGDRELVNALKPRVLSLFNYFRRFRNSDNLLEKLESWVFVEWSAANSFVQDVNYPTNMLYAGALAATGRLYDMPELQSDADRIRETIRKQSWDGRFFRDHAVRKDGQLEVRPDHTETCQYYAFFFDVATPQTYAGLWKILRTKFGPDRKQTKAFPDVPESNSFIGNMLRFEMLSRYGQGRQILDEAVAYLLYMADRTGTLWENVGPYASCDHGFASHIVHTLYRDVLGAYNVDSVNRAVLLRLGDLPLSWCEGLIPTADGAVAIRWWKDGEKIAYRIELPAGYDVKVENISGRELVRRP
jgi:alpha-L-rhamnosidase